MYMNQPIMPVLYIYTIIVGTFIEDGDIASSTGSVVDSCVRQWKPEGCEFKPR